MHLVTVGGSDAGISAALRARELDSSVEVTVVVADAYPNFSICGIPYYISGDVPHWSDLAHRTREQLEATGIRLELDTRATQIDVGGRALWITGPEGREETLAYDALVVGTGAVPFTPPIHGLHGRDALGATDGVHLLHSIGDTHSLMSTLLGNGPDAVTQPQVPPHSAGRPAQTAIVIGAGYIGLEMAEALTTRGLQVTQFEALPQVLPTVDPELGALINTELQTHGVQVLTSTTVRSITRAPAGSPGHLQVAATRATRGAPEEHLVRNADLVLVVVGVRPDVHLAASAGATLGVKGAIDVDDHMRTNLPAVFAAGDCAVTHHQLLGKTWLPLGTTAHKQGRTAGENAIGGDRRYPGSLGTQVVKVFDAVAARTGLREGEARTSLTADPGDGASHAPRWTPATTSASADDHKAYYPGATPIIIRVTGNTTSTGHEAGRLLGAQLVGRRSAEIAKRVDLYATAIHHRMTVEEISDLDLSYTPPLGSPWDAVQIAAQTWTRLVADPA